MSNVTMKLEGLDQLQRALARVPDQVAGHAGAAVQASAVSLADRARRLVPVRSGALRAAITSEAKGTRGAVGLNAEVVGGQAPFLYWRFVEFGTAHAPAQPFFRPAADAEADAFLTRMRAIGLLVERDLSTGK